MPAETSETVTPDMVREFVKDLTERNSFGEVQIILRGGSIEQVRYSQTMNAPEFSDAYRDRANSRRKVFVVAAKKGE